MLFYFKGRQERIFKKEQKPLMPQYHFNSTIKIPMGICEGCPPSKGKQPLKSKKPPLCQYHYDVNSKLKSMAKSADREVSDNDMPDLVAELDAVFSRFVRLSAADANGNCSCYICDSVNRWEDCDAMHFVPRANMLLRFDTRNVKCGCRTCNQYLDGNLVLYSKRLNEANIGVTEVLLEESHLVYKYGRFELLGMIKDYSEKVIKFKLKLSKL